VKVTFIIALLLLEVFSLAAAACRSQKRAGDPQTEQRDPSGQTNQRPDGPSDQDDASSDNTDAPAAAESEPAADTSPDSAGSISPIRIRPPELSTRSAGGLSQVQMQNVDFHVDDAVVLRIKTLRGALAGKSKARPPAFDDKQSFIIKVDSGNVGISTASLTALMNNYVFAYPHAPLKKIAIATEPGRIKIKGIVHKVADIHFEIAGDVEPTPEGKIRIHPASIKADGVPVKRLMHLFGLDLAKLIKAGQARGVEIQDDDLILDPELIIPAPEVRGKVTSVQIEGDKLVLIYGGTGRTKRLVPYDRSAPNYMYFRGGTIRFGKLTMANADMQIVDAHPKDTFDFSIDHYNRQLVAGYSKNTPRYGLVVFMPDYYQVK